MGLLNRSVPQHKELERNRTENEDPLPIKLMPLARQRSIFSNF